VIVTLEIVVVLLVTSPPPKRPDVLPEIRLPWSMVSGPPEKIPPPSSPAVLFEMVVLWI
jgi:hypothetical protein